MRTGERHFGRSFYRLEMEENGAVNIDQFIEGSSLGCISIPGGSVTDFCAWLLSLLLSSHQREALKEALSARLPGHAFYGNTDATAELILDTLASLSLPEKVTLFAWLGSQDTQQTVNDSNPHPFTFPPPKAQP